MAVSNIYAPNIDSPGFFENIFKKTLELQAVHYIIGGDFNLMLNNDLDSYGRKTNNEKSRNDPKIIL